MGYIYSYYFKLPNIALWGVENASRITPQARLCISK